MVDFKLTDIGGAAKLMLHGRLDAAGVDRIESPLLASVLASAKDTIVDLGDVDFISSLGIRMLLRVTEALGVERASLVLYGAQPLVAESLNLAVKQLVSLVEDEAQALARLTVRDADRG